MIGRPAINYRSRLLFFTFDSYVRYRSRRVPVVGRMTRLVCCCAVLLLLTACGSDRRSAPRTSGDSSAGYYKVGQPYQVKGVWYYPKEDFSYDETGIASWYGEDFHDKKTANGEIYNKNELTAAHATLPMPSLARVTNLENGRSLVVRINDRGPFSGARIIDMSQRSAQLLGFEKQGTAKVRVQVLADESKAIADAMRRYGGPSPQTVQVASADNSVAALPVYGDKVTSQPLEPLSTHAALPQPLEPAPPTVAQVKAIMKTIQPVQEVHQLEVTGSQQIFVQAGAFTKIENATRLQQKLASIGQVRVANADVKGVRFYRVRLGPVESVALADKLLNKVVQAGHREARIIVD